MVGERNLNMPESASRLTEQKSLHRRAFPRAALVKVLGFATALRLGWLAFTASLAAAFLATFRFFFPNARAEPRSSIRVGYPSRYNQVGKVYTEWQQSGRFWLVRTAGGIYALSTVCTHLGCTPIWMEKEEKFKCPCHGSGFHRSGINFEGPAPRPLERFRIVLAEDGQILVDKSKVYQQEKGQWDDPESFLSL